MFKNYIILHYITTFLGLTSFSYKITKNEINFSFPKLKIVYCVTLFIFFFLYLILASALSCIKFVSKSFFNEVFYLSFLVGWSVLYLNNFLNTKKLTTLLKDLYTLEQMKKPQRRNTHLLNFCAQSSVILLIFMIQFLNVVGTNVFEMPDVCLIVYFIEYLIITFVLFTFVFIITELRILVFEWQNSLELEEKAHFQIEQYKKIMLYMKNIFKDANEIFQVPLTSVFALNFLNVLVCFYAFLSISLFRTAITQLPQKLAHLHAPLMWFIQGFLGNIILIYHIDECAKDLKNFSDILATKTEKMDLECKEVTSLFRILKY